MRLPRARHLLLLVALLHLAADVAVAGGAVICVGPEGHRALETKHVAGAGCEARPMVEEPSLDSRPGGCSDSPVHPEADIAPGSQDPTPLAPTLLALPSPLAAEPPLRPSSTGAHQRAPDVGSGLIAQRTTVLLL